MKKSKKDNNKRKRAKKNSDKIATSGKITHEEIEKNAGFLGTKGRLLKALMEEKEIERNF